MKVICIKNTSGEKDFGLWDERQDKKCGYTNEEHPKLKNITIGKKYERLDNTDYRIEVYNYPPSSPKIKIRNDAGTEAWYYESCFITIDEFRESKLNELGI